MFRGTHLSGRIWVAALLATSALSGLSAAPQAAAQTEATRRFDIPAQALGEAILAYGRQSGVQVTAGAELIAGRRSRAVSGELSASEALGRLLEGTGLTYRFVGAGAVTLEAAPQAGSGAIQLGAIRVEGAGMTGGNVAHVPGDSTYEGDAADAPYRTSGSVNYISREHIERFRGSTAGDIFKSTPGVISGMNRNGSAVDVNIRGLQGMNRVVTAVDGAEQSSSTWRGYAGVDNRTYIDPDLTGGVTITKGPDGGASGAIGGTVLIRTLDAGDILKAGETYGVRLKGSLSSNGISPQAAETRGWRHASAQPGLLDAGNGAWSLAAAARLERIDLVAAFVQRRTGNYFAGKYGDLTVNTAPWQWATNSYDRPLSYFKYHDEVPNTSEEVTSGLLKATVRLSDDHTLRLGYLRYESTWGEVTPTVVSSGNPSYGRQLRLSTIELDQFTGRYDWKPLGNDWIDLRVNGWISTSDEQSTYGFLGSGSIPFLSRNRSYGIETRNISRFNTAWGDVALRLGGSWKLEDTRPRLNLNSGQAYDTYSPDGTRRLGAAYIKGQWQPAHWVTLDAGVDWLHYETNYRGTPPYLRYTRRYPAYASYEDSAFSPNLGVTFTPNEAVQLYVRYSSGIRPPSLREANYTASDMIFNPDLKHERAQNWEAGVNYLKDGLLLDGDKSRFRLAYFENTTKDYIGRINLSWGANLTPRNYDRVEMKGVELSAHYSAGPAFADLAISHYTDFRSCETKDVCVGYTRQSDYISNHIPPEWTFTLSGGVNLFADRLTLGGRINHVSTRLSPVVPQTTPYYFTITTLWAPYTVGDLFATWRVNGNLSLEAAVENVTDQYYVDALGNTDVPSPGRNIRIGLTSRFGGSEPLWGGRLFGSDGTAKAFDGDWGGFYAGFGLGHAFVTFDSTHTNSAGAVTDHIRAEDARRDADNLLSQLVIGGNYQYANGVVIGIEADLNWARHGEHYQLIGSEGHANLSRDGYFEADNAVELGNWLSTVRGRLGYSFGDLLLYGTAGVALVEEKRERVQYRAANSASPTSTAIYFNETDSGDRTGWVLGGGIERAIGNKWSVRTEYLFADFRDTYLHFPEARQGIIRTRGSVAGSVDNIEGRVVKSALDYQSLKVGLNYRF